MTIEIKQLIVRARAERSGAPAEGDATRRPGTSGSAPAERTLGAVDQDALVAACVRAVMRELRRARDR